LLIILGLVGIITPYIMTIATLAFVAYLMVVAGLLIFYFTYLANRKDFLGYLK